MNQLSSDTVLYLIRKIWFMKVFVRVDRVHVHPADITSEGRVLCTNFASSLLDIYWIMSNTGVVAHDFRNLLDECLMKVLMYLVFQVSTSQLDPNT